MQRVLATAFVFVMGCDLALLPETADWVGRPTAVAEVAIGAMDPSPPAGVDAVEIEVVDVRLHRPNDDAWLLLGSETAVVDLVQPAMNVAFPEVPLGLEHYDALAVVIGDVRVSGAGGDAEVVVVENALEIDGLWSIEHDVRIELRFDVAGSLWRADGQWHFAPAADVGVRPAL